MTPRRPTPIEARLRVLLEKNLAAREQFTAVLSRVQAAPADADNKAGLLSREQVCALLGIGPTGLAKRIQRGTVPRPRTPRGRGPSAHQRFGIGGRNVRTLPQAAGLITRARHGGLGLTGQRGWQDALTGSTLV
jgi:hypothetical protein